MNTRVLNVCPSERAMGSGVPPKSAFTCTCSFWAMDKQRSAAEFARDLFFPGWKAKD